MLPLPLPHTPAAAAEPPATAAATSTLPLPLPLSPGAKTESVAAAAPKTDIKILMAQRCERGWINTPRCGICPSPLQPCASFSPCSEARYAELEAVCKEMELSETDEFDYQFREFVVAGGKGMEGDCLYRCLPRIPTHPILCIPSLSVRAKPGTADAKQLKDWVPAASLATLTQSSQEADETFLTDAVSSVAREVFGCMCNSIPSVKSFSPSSIEVGVGVQQCPSES